MAGAGILAQPVVGLANIIRLINRLPNLAGKTVLSGSSNLFIPHLHGFSTGRTVNDAVEQIVKRTGIAFHNSWSTVNDFPYLLPFFRGYDCFMAILDNFSILTRDNVIGVGANPFLMCPADQMCALIKRVSQDMADSCTSP